MTDRALALGAAFAAAAFGTALVEAIKFERRARVGLSPADAASSALVAVVVGALAALSPWAGALLDRVPLRRLMLVTALVGTLQATCLAALALTDSIRLPWVILLAFVLGCVQVFDRPAVQAFLGELVPREMIPRAVSLASSA